MSDEWWSGYLVGFLVAEGVNVLPRFLISWWYRRQERKEQP